ncbi:MAG: TlpA family protein disulfide reductase [Saprospiraceae bacterium]|nr:TlpA family protein disulfide reductase [Bacteroidia bacterium]NNE16782.1 TlpA family protein disulfide reductase [Saprospiraceae bacterium]NNL92830.1 TlpA family protein disulfide reductase [Saprospiraceae bacterium]
MNKIIIALSLTVLVLACKPGEVEVKDISFSGKIENPKGDTLFLRNDDIMEKYAVAEDGTFGGTFQGIADYYIFSYNRESAYAYLKPGDETTVSLDTKEFDESLKFEGSGAAENNYLVTKYLISEKLAEEMSTKELYSMEEDTFVYNVKNQEKAMIENLEASSISKAFSEIEADNIKYYILGKLNRYKSYHSYFTDNDGFEPSEAFNKQFESIDFENETLFKTVPSYNSLVLSHFTKDELSESLAALKPIQGTSIKNAVIKRLTSWLSPGEDNLKSLVDEMISLTDDNELVAELNDAYSNMEKLIKGNDSPGFEYKSVKGGMVNLEDLKGKNVYIDVWATWCGPCKAEIPHLKELEKQYHGENIEFVSISVDEPKDEAKWEQMISDKDLKGVQLLSDNGWDTDFVNNYLIRGIPRFILLDKDGKIVSADAPRPSSDDKIQGMIEDLL